MKQFILTSLFISMSVIVHAQAKDQLVKKWHFEGYVYWGMTFDPEEIEKGDFIDFTEDGTYLSVSQGKPGKGTWIWEADSRLLQMKEEEGIMRVRVIELSDEELIILAEQDGDEVQLKFVTRN